MRSTKPAVGFIFITVMLDVLGFGLLIPVGPSLVKSLLPVPTGGTPAEIATRLAAEAAPYVGGLMTTWYIMSFLFAPTLGCLSDRIGRRPVILIALFGSGLDFFAQAIAPSLVWLFITRAINGLSGASMTVANAYIADVTPPEKRAAAFGMLGAAFGIGFVFGPLIGGVLGDERTILPFIGHGGIRLPFYAAGVLCLINWLYGFFLLPESLPPERRSHMRWSRVNPAGSFGSLTHYPVVQGMAASIFLLSLAMFGLHGTWVLYTGHRYGWGPRDVAISLAIVGVGAAVVQGGLARKIVPWLGEKKSVIIGIFIGVLAYTGYGLATEGWMIYAVIAVASIGAFSQPAAQALITHAVRPDEQGAVQGALASLQSLAGIFGGLIGTEIFSYFISEKAPFKLEGAPFFSSAALAALGLLVAVWAINRPSTSNTRPPGDGAQPGPA